MGQIHVDDMTVEIVCNDLRDFRANSVGAVSKNMFDKNRPDGGARGGPCEQSVQRHYPKNQYTRPLGCPFHLHHGLGYLRSILFSPE